MNHFLIILLGSCFTIFSCMVMAYISMATMIGPWLAPTIVLMSSIILKIRSKNVESSQFNQELVLIQTIGSVGAAVSLAIGFFFPTIYFLDHGLFYKILNNKLIFLTFFGFLTICAGGLGLILARLFVKRLLKKEELSFPVSKLIFDIINSQVKEKSGLKLLYGFFSSFFVCFLRDGILRFKGFIPKTFYLFSRFLGTDFAITLSPILWAIGFTTGITLVLPMFIGLLTKFFLINYLLEIDFFSHLTEITLLTAFCAGLVLSDLIWGAVKNLKNYFQKIYFGLFENNISFKFSFVKKDFLNFFKVIRIETIFVLFSSFLFFYLIKFTLLSFIVLLFLIIAATYETSYLASKIGLMTLGRFATFIMLPMIFIFDLNFLQITMICLFFGLVASLATGLLFNYKLGSMSNINFRTIYKYQWIGLVVTSFFVGIIFFLIFSHFTLGSTELFAQRGQSRALLIRSLDFDLISVGVGFVFGLILKFFKVSPTMVLGGVLMPNSLTLALLFGAIVSLFSKKKEGFQAFWAGVFTGESIWILAKILLKS